MSEFPETRDSLIERVKDVGDDAAWLEFFGIYQPVVYRMARRRGLQDADAHDVMQQVFGSVARSIDRWVAGENQPPFRAWVAAITRNAVTKALVRRPKDRAAGSTSVLQMLHGQADPAGTAEEMQNEARREAVRWATKQIQPEFTEQTWKIFWQTSIEGVPIAEAARSSGRSTGAIYVTRYRVIARLKEKVAELSSDWDLGEVATDDH